MKKEFVTVRQISSPIRRQKYQEECLKGLGLGRLNRSKVLPHNDIVKGLIKKIGHLIEVNIHQEG